jgi:hypothetical protein
VQKASHVHGPYKIAHFRHEALLRPKLEAFFAACITLTILKDLHQNWLVRKLPFIHQENICNMLQYSTTRNASGHPGVFHIKPWQKMTHTHQKTDTPIQR